ncbi:hypothetical protein O7A70_32725 [Mesorhizobium sp. Cs1299R1N1]|uniref:DUF7007 domain-containing protein n=1 Tax=Mesorhizobium sp. Cs1299R1N1 TaxID=3015172 RepID=UPI00301C1C86
MTYAPRSSNEDSISGYPEVEFGRSADGVFVARTGDTAFAMLPASDGRHYMATGWRIRRPIAEWTRSDFYGHFGALADEAAFRAKVEENAEHNQERRALARREIRSTANTPWGPSQGATVFAEGVIYHSTASHGGFHLSPERNAKVHARLRAADGFYEEDECWAIVAFTFPHLFTSFERHTGERIIKDSFPEAWEAITGNVLGYGESREKDRRDFEAEHVADWIVVSAITSDHEKGFIECIATPGGRRGVGTEERRFLVPADEYEIGRFGFVIDPDRHVVHGGPSSFVGWQGRRGS